MFSILIWKLLFPFFTKKNGVQKIDAIFNYTPFFDILTS